MRLPVPRPLLGRIPNKGLVLLVASPNAGAGILEKGGVQSEEDWGIRCMGERLENEIKRLNRR